MTIQLRSIFFTSLDCFRGNNICYSNFNPVQEYIWVGSAESTLPQTHVDLFGFARGSDFNKALNLLERQVAQIFDDCREMLKIVGDFSYESTPPEIWTGKSSIKNLLQELWQTYSIRVKSQREPWFGFSDYDLHDLSNKIQKYYPLVKYLQVYQVNYPQPIEYIVPPAAIILSFANGEKGSPSYNKSVISAIERLASIKKPY